LAGRAPESWLDRYEAERRPVAVPLVGTADRVFAVITSEVLGARVGRRLPFSGDNLAALRSASWQVHACGAVDPARVADLADRLGLPVHVLCPPSTRLLRAGFFCFVRPDGFVAAEAAASEAAGAFRAAIAGGAAAGRA